MELLWTLDELCDHAFEMFEELAEDNLPPDQLALYQAHYDEHGFVAINDPADDWAEFCNVDEALHVEAVIGVDAIDDQPEKVLCRMLLSRDKDDHEVHAVWTGVKPPLAS